MWAEHPDLDAEKRDDDTALARAFEAERPLLLRVAYTILGTVTEAEDCVQEAWLRLQRARVRTAIRDLKAWLTTTVGRLALDTLTSARARREQYVGTWLPEPLVEPLAGPLAGPLAASPGATDPADQVIIDESVSMALMVVLESLTPAERTAFILHDIFGLPFDEIAGIVERTPAAVRKLASRARQRVKAGRPRRAPTYAEQHRIVEAFTQACAAGDFAQLVALLDPDVVWRGDGGGKVPTLNRIERGAETVARGLLAFAGRLPAMVRTAQVNGAPGLVLKGDDGALTVLAVTIDHGSIVAIDVIRNPDKLRAVRLH